MPPAADTLHRKRRGVVITTHIDPSHILSDIINPVGNCFGNVRIDEVVDKNFFWFPLWPPLATLVVIAADQLLLFGVHRDDRISLIQRSTHTFVQIMKLTIP